MAGAGLRGDEGAYGAEEDEKSAKDDAFKSVELDGS
jgi:hypothetical protein